MWFMTIFFLCLIINKKYKLLYHIKYKFCGFDFCFVGGGGAQGCSPQSFHLKFSPAALFKVSHCLFTMLLLHTILTWARVPNSIKQLALGWKTGVQFPAEEGIFLFVSMSRESMGTTEPLIQWVLQIKLLECETDHSPVPNAKIRNV
jgi:hypothetical protein